MKNPRTTPADPGHRTTAGRAGWRRTPAIRLAVLVATALAAALITGAGPALAAPSAASAPAVHHPFWTVVRLHGHSIKVHPHGRFGVVHQLRHGQRAAAAASGNNLNYSGGPVAHNPTVYLDFWGSQWNSDGNGVAQYMQDFMSGLGGSGDNWSTITSQYTDSSGQGPVFGGSVLGGTWFDNSAAAPASASQSDLAAEAVTAAQQFGVSGDDIDIFVLSPSGTQPDGFPNAGFCAWHDYTSSSSGNIPYTNMPYVLDAGSSCGANSVQNQLDGFSIVGGHEYAEAVTDPEPASGWVDSSGQEIGDKCAWQNLSTLSLSTGTFAVQPLWSNNDSGCTLSAP